MSEYYWVPENAIFESAADATEFMNLGAGCLVASHVAYDKLRAENKELKELVRDAEQFATYCKETGYVESESTGEKFWGTIVQPAIDWISRAKQLLEKS